MTRRVGGPWVGRPRAVVLLVLAVAALADLTSYVVLVSDTGPASATPGSVALAVTSAVAEEDCTGIGDLLASDAELPPAVTACLDGRPGDVGLSDLAVVDEDTDGASSRVVVGMLADGASTEVVVDLRRDGDRWRVTGVRAAG